VKDSHQLPPFVLGGSNIAHGSSGRKAKIVAPPELDGSVDCGVPEPMQGDARLVSEGSVSCNEMPSDWQ
jgi:hypothetical protein